MSNADKDTVVVGADAGIHIGTLSREVVSCDQEAWIRNSIYSAVRSVIALKETLTLGVEHDTLQRATDAIVDGTAQQIIRTLNREPSFVNIRKFFTNNAGNSIKRKGTTGKCEIFTKNAGNSIKRKGTTGECEI